MNYQEGHSGANTILGIVLLLIVAIFLVYFFTPLFRGPAGKQINVPENININPQ